MHSTSSIIRFVIVMTSIVALILAALQNGLKARHDRNESLYSKKATLAAVSNEIDGDFSKLTDADIQNIFDNQIVQSVIDASGKIYSEEELLEMGVKNGKAENLDLAKEWKKPAEERLRPVYKFTNNSSEDFYILYTRGKGLWDEIWGNIALKSDINTVAGVSFDHKAETPGLGAEIKENKSWVRQFIGKKIYDGLELASITVRKGGAKDPNHEVDGISGATITADGVTAMLETGLEAYRPYLETLKN